MTLEISNTHIFDVWAWVNSDNIAVFDAEIMSYDTVHTRAPIIQFIICEDNENSVLALLALHENGIATEQL
jgi:hypothetical protein